MAISTDRTLSSQLRAKWVRFKHGQPGKRFIDTFQQNKAQSQGPLRFVYPLLTVLCFAIGVVLAIIPGPAFIFFGIGAALLSLQSKVVAHLLDRLELWVRAKKKTFDDRRARRQRLKSRHSSVRPSRLGPRD